MFTSDQQGTYVYTDDDGNVSTIVIGKSTVQFQTTKSADETDLGTTEMVTLTFSEDESDVADNSYKYYYSEDDDTYIVFSFANNYSYVEVTDDGFGCEIYCADFTKQK